MSRNLKLLDRFDRGKNIYELISRLSERAHAIMSGKMTSSETRKSDPVQIAMEEYLKEEEKE